MNLKIKISNRKIFFSIYIVIFITNLSALILLAQFIKNFVYGSIVVDPNFIQSQQLKTGNNLDTNKFDAIIKVIESKQGRKENSNIKNIFN
jgi:hypothetical protein